MFTDYCGACAPLAYSSGDPIESDAAPEAPAASASTPGIAHGNGGSTVACAWIGGVCLAVGGYLLMDPTSAKAGPLGIDIGKVVNLQLLTIGQTLAVMGAIFLAAAIRPR
ncbi:hypothetical protein [Thermomonas sp.]|uniref:hypothetical protein n=1 Tax=Thermomonas sp. TaxID=1971895 RepID=UPI003D0A23AF